MRLLAITTEPESPAYERFVSFVKGKRTRLYGITGKSWTFGLAFVVRGKPKPPPEPEKPKPHWFVGYDDDYEVYRVQWSEPLANGEYFSVAQYPDGWIGREEAEKQAKAWNRDRTRRFPEAFREYRIAAFNAREAAEDEKATAGQ